VRQNIGFGLKMRNVAKDEAARRIEEAVRLVRLQGQEDKLPGQLSGGQQQRVSIARAVVIEPPLVLMDEPLSNLDAKLRLEMRAEIRRIHNTLGATTVYVTHDQDEALSLADRIVVLRDGTIRQIGRPSELYEAPDDVEVAEFMGFRNRLEGRCVSNGAGLVRLETDHGVLTGRARHSLTDGAAAVALCRTEDLCVAATGADGIRATVDAVEYRGREFVGSAHTPGGTQVTFRSEHETELGKDVTLVADPQRVLIFQARRGN